MFLPLSGKFSMRRRAPIGDTATSRLNSFEILSACFFRSGGRTRSAPILIHHPENIRSSTLNVALVMFYSLNDDSSHNTEYAYEQKTGDLTRWKFVTFSQRVRRRSYRLLSVALGTDNPQVSPHYLERVYDRGDLPFRAGLSNNRLRLSLLTLRRHIIGYSRSIKRVQKKVGGVCWFSY